MSKIGDSMADIVAVKNAALPAADLAMSVQQVRDQVNLIQHVMREVMRDGEHFGKIPGCGDKPALLKAGAEKLAMVFHLAPSFEIRKTDLPGGHREYEIVCTLTHSGTGRVVGAGVGCCSSLESKYRWRGGSRLCPECKKATIKKSKFPPKNDPKAAPGWYCYSKVGGCGKEFAANDVTIMGQSEERQENPDPADQFNSILNMAKKRAQVDATLTATAASDIFTQDIEDAPAAETPLTMTRIEPAKSTATAAPAKSGWSSPKLKAAWEAVWTAAQGGGWKHGEAKAFAEACRTATLWPDDGEPTEVHLRAAMAAMEKGGLKPVLAAPASAPVETEPFEPGSEG